MSLLEPQRIFESKGLKFLLTIEDSNDPEDYRKYEDLREEIWAFPEDHLAGTRNLLCENFLHEGGSLFIAAYHEEPGLGWLKDKHHLVGFAYGFVGVKNKAIAFRDQTNLWFYAQFLGVKEEWQGYGLGIAIKEFQRDIVRDWFGLDFIVCTYDPLTAVNAYRNVHYFGMKVLEYRIAPYGEYGGRLNRLDIPSDRFFMGWDITRLPKKLDLKEDIIKSERIVNQVDLVEVEGKDGSIRLEVIKEINPSPKVSPILVRIPVDFYSMLRATDVASSEIRRIPLDWRLKTRELFLSLFKQGYSLVDFLLERKLDETRAYYLLIKE
ncbi:MAG: hypothetical protein N3B16_00080 [Candidatus Aminicenantes bacterium]|nr:hypothetical protein [Candidatus Aminicenantes bacterium]